MFEEFMGIPAHPLFVHAPVVLVPLLALLAVAYAVIPVVRRHTQWVLGVLAVAAPLAAVATKLSGDAFFERMDARGNITEGFYPVLEEHQELGTMTMWSTLALGLLVLALVYFVRPAGQGTRAAVPAANRIVGWTLTGLVVVAAAVSLYYIIRTGDTGAKAVWTGQ